MLTLLPFIIGGLTTGSLYGLAGMGLVLTYRTSGVFNFGHGAIAAAGAFLFYSLHSTHGVPWPIAGIVTVGLFGLLGGLALERLTRALGDALEVVVVVATVGILLLTEGLLYLMYGDVTRYFPQFLPTSGFMIADVTVSWAQVISVAVASVSALGLYLYLGRSRIGIAMRAVVDDPVLVGLAGERPVRIRRAAWSTGCAFAAVSGILLAPTLGLDANLLTLLVVQAFGACAIGRFSSLPGTYVGGLLVGVGASVATRYATSPRWVGLPPTVPYLFLIGVLLFVPLRKLPTRRMSPRALVAEAPPLSTRGKAAVAMVMAGALVVPFVVGTKLPVWTSGLTYVVLFGSLALLVWTSGQISLCHMAFAALGATTMAHLAADHHLPWGVALALAGLTVVPVGALVAIPALRLSGIYLALITLGFAVLMQNVVYSTFLMFTSQLTVTAPRPSLGTTDRQLYYVVLLVAALTCGVLAVISRSRLGRLLRAMAETPTMLVTHGLDVNVTRLIVFCVSAFFAGIAGALSITQTGAASGIAFGPIQSLLLVAVLAVCGTRLLRSAILAALLLAVAPAYIPSIGVNQQTAIFGAAALLAALLAARRAEVASWLARGASSSEARVSAGPARHRWDPAAAAGARAP